MLLDATELAIRNARRARGRASLVCSLGLCLTPLFCILLPAMAQTAQAPASLQPAPAAKAATNPTGSSDPVGTAIGKAGESASSPAGAFVEGAKNFLSTLANGNFAVKTTLHILATDGAVSAFAAANALPDPADRKTALWLIATSADPKVSGEMIAQVMQELKDWPGQNLLRLRFELAFLRGNPAPAMIVQALSGTPTPISEGGTLALASAYRTQGRAKDVGDLLRPYWRNNRFSEDTEKTIIKDFLDVLTKADHQARVNRLLYDGQADEALRAAKFLDKDAKALAESWGSVVKRNGTASAKLAAVPAALRKDPTFIFASAVQLRRQEKFTEAAATIFTAPTDPKLLIDPDAWSAERRLIARKLVEAGDAKTAYRLVAGHSATGRTERLDAEWDAGWYAFHYLKDAKRAEPHFRAIGEISPNFLSQSRAQYWLGRTSETLGDRESASGHFRKAAQYPTAYYGQLAAAKLNIVQLNLPSLDSADAATKQRFEERELVKALARLNDLARVDDAAIFYRTLSDRLSDPAEFALLGAMAERAGHHRSALIVGKVAQVRAIGSDALAFPMSAIPRLVKESDVELAAIYAVARQESSFDMTSSSSAGALGLMQLLPGTAKETAGFIGIAYSKDRLTSDAGYNATLGAAFLAGLVNDFNGSYALAFAAYNAGKRRVTEWIKLMGDPRDPKVDPIDWVERIPFNETRNYVQRTLENLQVYRARAGSPNLRIQTDLVGRRS